MRQKFKNYVIKPVFFLFCLLSVFLFSCVGYLSSYLPGSFYVYEGKSFSVTAPVPVYCDSHSVQANAAKNSGLENYNYTVNLKAFGFIPVKSATVSVIDQRKVAVLGDNFGIKIYTAGVLVVKLDTVDTEHGHINIAEKAGLRVGDTILSINGQVVGSNEEVAEIIEKCGGKKINLSVRRGNEALTISVKPEISYASGKYKAGIWVRDSSAGIGTLTFYSPTYDVLCGLGHGVCDSDTGELLPLNSGELVAAHIISITKGIDGCPGQLEGVFEAETLGKMLANDETGVYAWQNRTVNPEQLTTVALKQEVQPGDAQIFCALDETGPKLYQCKIEKVSYNNQKTKNLIVKVTDPALIEKTGGIVQGMSGSPILQNGKLIGAVTHVFVDDPTAGYAIFAENMLNEAETVAKKANSMNEQKDAS